MFAFLQGSSEYQTCFHIHKILFTGNLLDKDSCPSAYGTEQDGFPPALETGVSSYPSVHISPSFTAARLLGPDTTCLHCQRLEPPLWSAWLRLRGQCLEESSLSVKSSVSHSCVPRPQANSHWRSFCISLLMSPLTSFYFWVSFFDFLNLLTWY